MHSMSQEFTSLPLQQVADAALQAARDAGAEHADVRVERLAEQVVRLRDGSVERLSDSTAVGLAVRVVHGGTWGFAGSVDVSIADAVAAARAAVEVAVTSAALNAEPVELADEPSYADATYISDYDIDPFSVDSAEKVALLQEWSQRLLAQDDVDHVDAYVHQVKENKFYADTAGTRTTQQRVRIHPTIEATRVDPGGGFETMRTLAAPAGRGWEYLTGTGFDWAAAIEQLPTLLVEKAKASSVEPGAYDLVIDPTNLWLTIHESIGHATELDRALGYEAAYAGTSFATLDQLGTLKYGTDVMHVVGDRTMPHGLASIGWDDEGVQGQSFDLVRDGVLVGYQLDRRMARQNAAALGTARSNGCAYADSPGHVPVQRMANVSLQPAAGGPTLEELIGRVDRGIYVVGDKSWSIDMQRYNFQFTGQRFYEIRGGRLVGQLRDVAYQATTTEFWGSMEAVGGPATYHLGGAFNCGKAQPGQVAAVSHGSPAALFRGINILNTQREGGR